MLYNTGETIVNSTHGLLTTVGYQLGPKAKPVYALEVYTFYYLFILLLSLLLNIICFIFIIYYLFVLNLLLKGSVAVAGSAIKWLRDNLGIIQKASDMGIYSISFLIFF